MKYITKNLAGVNKSAVLKMKKVQEKHEPIIYNKEVGPIEDFFQVAKGLDLTHIIYVQDSAGGNKSVWATNNDDLIDCLYTFSEKFYFGRIQSIERACEYGFDDMSKQN